MWCIYNTPTHDTIYYTIFAKIFSRIFAGDRPRGREHEGTVEQQNTFEHKFSYNQKPNLWWFKPCIIEFQTISWLNLIIFLNFFCSFIHFYPKPFIFFVFSLSSPYFCDFWIRAFHFRLTSNPRDDLHSWIPIHSPITWIFGKNGFYLSVRPA